MGTMEHFLGDWKRFLGARKKEEVVSSFQAMGETQGVMDWFDRFLLLGLKYHISSLCFILRGVRNLGHARVGSCSYNWQRRVTHSLT